MTKAQRLWLHDWLGLKEGPECCFLVDDMIDTGSTAYSSIVKTFSVRTISAYEHIWWCLRKIEIPYSAINNSDRFYVRKMNNQVLDSLHALFTCSPGPVIPLNWKFVNLSSGKTNQAF
jgi:hypothetical protein